jgi:hypothetical protein
MRTGNARTSVKPGRRQETRSVGYAVRPRRLPPTLPPPQSPVGLLARNELSDLVAQPLLPPPRAKRARRRRGPARCQDLPSWSDAHLAGDVTRPARRGLHGRERQARPIAVIVPAVGLARGEERHSGDGLAGPASSIEQNQPTGVTTRCGLRCLAGLRQRLDAVACLCIKSNSSVRGSARIAPACHRSVILQA